MSQESSLPARARGATSVAAMRIAKDSGRNIERRYGRGGICVHGGRAFGPRMKRFKASELGPCSFPNKAQRPECICFMRVAVFRRSLSRAENHPTVILSERGGAGVGAKDPRTNPGADPRSSQRSFAPPGPTHPSLRMTQNFTVFLLSSSALAL